MIALRRALLWSMAAAGALLGARLAWPGNLRALLRTRARPNRAPSFDTVANGPAPQSDSDPVARARAPTPRIVALAEDGIGPADDLAG